MIDPISIYEAHCIGTEGQPYWIWIGAVDSEAEAIQRGYFWLGREQNAVRVEVYFGQVERSNPYPDVASDSKPIAVLTQWSEDHMPARLRNK